jgi:hypothetical protein
MFLLGPDSVLFRQGLAQPCDYQVHLLTAQISTRLERRTMTCGTICTIKIAGCQWALTLIIYP